MFPKTLWRSIFEHVGDPKFCANTFFVKFRSGGRFLNTSGPHSLHEKVFCKKKKPSQNELFKTVSTTLSRSGLSYGGFFFVIVIFTVRTSGHGRKSGSWHSCKPRVGSIYYDLTNHFQNKGPPAGSQTRTTNSLFTKRPFTTQNMESEMAMDLCIDEKDEERESEAQSVVRAKKRAPPHPLPTRRQPG